MAHRRQKILKTPTRMTDLRRQLLERERKLQLELLAVMRSHSERDLSESADVVDLAVNTSEREMAFRIAEMRSREMMQIDDALQKISEGTYGICEECGRDIPLARLQARYSASLCVRCQLEYEASTKAQARPERWDRIAQMPTDMTPVCATRSIRRRA